MAEKMIRGSKRGLTFSFHPRGRFGIGSTYEYIIESKEHPEIRIVPAKAGAHTVSRKRSGEQWLSLIDLRSKEILSAIAGMEKISITIRDSEIVVCDAKAKSQRKAPILHISRGTLASLRLAAGIEDAAAVDTLIEGAQITFDEYLASKEASAIHSIQRDLVDVYTLVSLFSGAGILDWPFAQDSRFSIRYAIDYDGAACETYRQNIGLHIVHGDVHKAFSSNGYALDKTIADPDVIIGGPSCKPFSNANRHTRLEDHPDSNLVLQYMRIVKALRPKVFAMENVPEILTACGGTYFDAIRKAAEECGYQVAAKIVQDNKVGGYTTRRRAIILGSRIGPAVFSKIELLCGGKTAGDALCKVDRSWSNYEDVTLPGPDTKRRMSFVPQGGNYENIPPEFRTASKNRHSCTYRRLAWDAPSPTIVNWRKPPLIHPTEDRTLTVAEAKALQGLPGNFRICGSLGQMQQQVGNAVPVSIGRFLKESVLCMLHRYSNSSMGQHCMANAT